MSRFGYFAFNVLLIIALYWFAFGNKNSGGAVYTLAYFSIPYIALNFIMAVISFIRWFFSQDPQTTHEGLTFLHATWVLSLLTYGAYQFVMHSDSIIKFFQFKIS
jgi:hypothetical protein